MWHVGIDLHRATVVVAAVSDVGEAVDPVTIPCADTATIADTLKGLGMFRAVIEASGTYRWLYDLLRPHGTVLLAHCRPLDPRLAALRSGVAMILENPKSGP